MTPGVDGGESTIWSDYAGIARSLSGCEEALISLRTETGGWNQFGAPGSDPLLCADTSVAEPTWRHGSALISHQPRSHPALKNAAFLNARADLHFYGGLPLRARDGRLQGCLCVLGSRSDAPDPEALSHLEAFADLLSQRLAWLALEQQNAMHRAAQRVSLEQAESERAALLFSFEHGQIEPHFQPLFALRDRSIQGFEALARWRTNEGELLGPHQVLPRVNAAGLRPQFELQMITQSIARSHTLAAIAGPMVLSLNLSGELLQTSSLQRLFHLLDQHPLPKGWTLQLEVLEEELKWPTETLLVELEALRSRGVVLAIDDFGTGYSSLSRLNSYPFESLKVDQSFIEQIDTNPAPSNRILEVIQAMAEALSLKTTAEGVETDAQCDWLHNHGFDWGQGYLVAPPMSLLDALRFLEDRNGLHSRQSSSSAAKKR